MKARELSQFISQRLGFGDWISHFAVAEAIPLSRTFDSYSPEELNALVAAQTSPFFSETNEDGKPSDNSAARRRKASRMLQYLLHARQAARALKRHGLKEHETADFSFALLCSAPTNYVGTAYNFFTDERLQMDDIDEVYAQNLVQGVVKQILSDMNNALKEFRDEHTFSDMTDDLKNETMETHKLCSSYFLGEADEEEEANDELHGAVHVGEIHEVAL